MAKIVNLDELVGEDIVFKYEGGEYRLPGDIPVETVFELFHMYVTIGDFGDAESGDEILEAVKRKFTDVRARLLELFQKRQPRLKELPFGIKGTGIVLRHALTELGVQVDAGNPTSPAPNRRTRRATAKRSTTKKPSTTKTKTSTKRR